MQKHTPPPLATVASRPPADLMGLMALGVEKSLPVEQLSRLMDLYEREQKMRAEAAFAEAMNACQQELPDVVRDAENTQTRKKYATLEGIQIACKPVYTRHGFSLSFGEGDSPLDGWKRTLCDVRHTAGHTVRYHVDLPLDGVGAKGGATSMNAIQGAVSSGSYGMRALVCRIFNITVAGLDNDAATFLHAIDQKQLVTLNTLIEETNTSLDSFLKWASTAAGQDIASLDQLPRLVYPKAVKLLDKKKREATS